ncbi:MAG: hypothetical protein MJK10_02445 [Pseudomonadales bacterium]|nr:hypothetical protein [Pseudomonadales bacterium]NRA14727.1 hypothetical protein [Oceanospirillaceae bacterium]
MANLVIMAHYALILAPAAKRNQQFLSIINGQIKRRHPQLSITAAD